MEGAPGWGAFLGSCCPLRFQKSPVEAPHSGVLRPGQTAILVRTSATSATQPNPTDGVLIEVHCEQDLESLREDLETLHEAGAIDKVTMREFDAICPPPVRDFQAADIKRLRESLRFSQPVFALHLHTSASTIRKWEQGETHPTGPALKLLNIIADKGLQAII